MTKAEWRDDLDALQFAAGTGGALCMIHRLAFRSLIGREPQKQDCIEWYDHNAAVFQAAAIDKMTRLNLPKDRNLHIDSRDVSRRMMAANVTDGQANPRPAAHCRVLAGR